VPGPPATISGRRRLRDPAVLLPLMGRELWPKSPRLFIRPRFEIGSSRRFCLLISRYCSHTYGRSCFPPKEGDGPNRLIQSVFFMEAGIISVVAVQRGDTRVEVGLNGCEGMSGTAVVLGGDQSPHSTYIQVAQNPSEHPRMSAPRERLRASGSSAKRPKAAAALSRYGTPLA
jgi:hypothetical protein